MNKTRIETLERAALLLGNPEMWDVIASGLNNATDTWRECRKPDAEYYTEEFYGFALDSIRSLLCDSASPECGQWFRKNGVQF